MSEKQNRSTIAIDVRNAIVGGAVAAAGIFLGIFFIGEVGNYEALVLLESILPTTRFFCSSAITASATMLALMLTVLSLGQGGDKNLRGDYYRRVQQIAWLGVLTFCTGVCLLLILNLPLAEEKENFQPYYKVIFYFIMSVSALLGGALITLAILIYKAVSDIITLLAPGVEDQHLVASDEETTQPDAPKREEAEKHR